MHRMLVLVTFALAVATLLAPVADARVRVTSSPSGRSWYGSRSIRSGDNYSQAAPIVDAAAELALGIVAEVQETRRHEVAAGHDDIMAVIGLGSVERISARADNKPTVVRTTAGEEITDDDGALQGVAAVKNGLPVLATITVIGSDGDEHTFRNVRPGRRVRYVAANVEDVTVTCVAHVPTAGPPSEEAEGSFKRGTVVAWPRPWGHECLMSAPSEPSTAKGARQEVK